MRDCSLAVPGCSSRPTIYCEKNQKIMKKNLNSRIFVVLGCVIGFIGWILPNNVHAIEKYDLIHQVRSDETLAIKTQVQYLGNVIVDRAGQEENETVLPLDVRAKMNFDQRISSGSTQSPQAIRYYDLAMASIQAGKGKTEIKLRDANRIILARMKNQSRGSHEFQIASIGSTLRQKEYELLKNPGDPLSYANLFNKTGVEIGDKWKVKKEQLTSLLAMNRIISSSATMLLKSVEDNKAKIYIYGSVKGEIDDVISDQKIKGIAYLDLTEQRISALRLSIDEERRAGQVAPGFEGKVKFDARIQPTSENILISKDHLAKLHKGQKIRFSFMFDRSDSDIQFLHDTRWRVIASEDEAAVLRYMDDGQLIAQCNVVQLPNRPSESPLKLAQFQEEVKKIVADSEARIVDSEKLTTATGLEALKVSVNGVESGIPFQWLYYHISNSDGRRVTFVFTVEKEAADYFKNADQELVQNVFFKEAAVSTANVGSNPKR